MSQDIQRVDKDSLINAKNYKIAVVQAEFNYRYTQGLYVGAKKLFAECQGKEQNLEKITVPGVVEIPLACQQLLKKQWFDAIVALGVVIRGDTSHFNYVCRMVSQGIMQVMLTMNTAIAFGVLTTDNEQQVEERTKDDEQNKGREAMFAALKMIKLTKSQ